MCCELILLVEKIDFYEKHKKIDHFQLRKGV